MKIGEREERQRKKGVLMAQVWEDSEVDSSSWSSHCWLPIFGDLIQLPEQSHDIIK